MLKDRELLSLILPTPPLFEAPARGNPLECLDEICIKKTRIMGLPEGEEIMTLALFVLTQYRLVTDRGTDRRRDTLRLLLPARSYASAGNSNKDNENSTATNDTFLVDVSDENNATLQFTVCNLFAKLLLLLHNVDLTM